jgi:cell division protease FtsH
LGYTLTPPETDKLQVTKSELLNDISVMLGGRAAEMLVFKEQTAGASNDIERATRMARAMVCEFGMSELGPMNFAPMYDNSYAKSWGEPAKISSQLQDKVDVEIKKFVDIGEVEAMKILKKYRSELTKVSEQLLETETLDGEEFAKLMGVPKVKPVIPEV